LEYNLSLKEQQKLRYKEKYKNIPTILFYSVLQELGKLIIA